MYQSKVLKNYPKSEKNLAIYQKLNFIWDVKKNECKFLIEY